MGFHYKLQDGFFFFPFKIYGILYMQLLDSLWKMISLFHY